MTTTRHYNPADLNSSPFEPAMGHNAIYRHPKIGHSKSETYPAIITHVYTEAEHAESFKADAVDLCVFTPRGVQFVTRVRFSHDMETDNTWDWVPELERRVVATHPDAKPHAGTTPKENAQTKFEAAAMKGYSSGN